MEPQINIVTLGVNDLEAMVEWYQAKFGWTSSRNFDGTISFRLANMVLILVPKKSWPGNFLYGMTGKDSSACC